MGDPIKITDLIRLSGYEPEKKFYCFTNRPGEKLYEELQMFNEDKVKTVHKKIMILKENKPPTAWNTYRESTKVLFAAAKTLDKDKIQRTLKHLLPSYAPTSFDPYVEKKLLKYSIKAKA